MPKGVRAQLTAWCMEFQGKFKGKRLPGDSKGVKCSFNLRAQSSGHRFLTLDRERTWAFCQPFPDPVRPMRVRRSAAVALRLSLLLGCRVAVTCSQTHRSRLLVCFSPVSSFPSFTDVLNSRLPVTPRCGRSALGPEPALPEGPPLARRQPSLTECCADQSAPLCPPLHPRG